jgi:hypothetical protein
METAVMIFGIFNVVILILNRLLETQNKLVVFNEIALIITIMALYVN